MAEAEDLVIKVKVELGPGLRALIEASKAKSPDEPVLTGETSHVYRPTTPADRDKR